jgi:hypothetical protein
LGVNRAAKSGTLRAVCLAEHGDAKLTDHLHALADCPKARALSLSTTDTRPATASIHELADKPLVC